MRYLKKLWMVLALVIIIAAIVSSLFRALTPWAKQYKGDVESTLSASLGKKVVIDNMETSWYWFYPVIKLDHVRIKNEGAKDLEIKKLLIGMNFFTSLIHWQFEPGILYIDGVELSLKQRDSGWLIEGFSKVSDGASGVPDESYQAVLARLLSQQKIILNNISGRLLFKGTPGCVLDYCEPKTEVKVRYFALTMIHNGNLFKIKADAGLGKNTNLQVRTELKGLSTASDRVEIDALKLNAKVYLSVQRLDLSLLHNFLPQKAWAITAGLGDGLVWLDWQARKIKDAQSRIILTNLTLENEQLRKKQNIPLLKANLAFGQSPTEWVLSADQIHLTLGSQLWPENSIMLRFKKQGGEIKWYVKHLIVEGLTYLLPPSVPQWDMLTQLQPHGRLLDSQGTLTNGKLDYLLTNFIDLGWLSSDTIPSINHLNGALSWQPTEGQMELDSQNVRVRFQKKTAFIANVITSLSWKELSHGLRIHLDNLVVENPEITLSGSGDFDEVTHNSLGMSQWRAEVSAQNVTKLVRFLPEKWIDPKWFYPFKQVKQWDKLTAEIKFQGVARDFPFQHVPGTFEVKSHVSGMDFLFSPTWPIVKDFDAYLQVDKDNFNADVVNANLLGIPVTNGNIKIENLGGGKETLLLHTNLSAPASNTVSYLTATPLYARLKDKLKLKAEGDINLDLKLEVPLYSDSNGTLALCELRLKDNVLKGRYLDNPFKIEGLTGSLRLDALGVLDGQLDASFLGYPISAKMQSALEPVRQLAVTLNGKSSMEVLGSQISLPVLSLMKGEFWFDGRLNVISSTADKPMHATMHLTSPLEGVRIDLPEPFKKSEKKDAPIILDLDVSDKALNFHLDYNKIMRSDLIFTKQEGKWLPRQGQIRLEDVEPLVLPASGTEVNGILSSFDVAIWKDFFEKIPLSEFTQRIFDSITRVNVLIKKIDLGMQHFPNTAIRAEKKGRDWIIGLNQSTIQGELRYLSKQNLFSGNFSKWRIEPLPDSNHALPHKALAYTVKDFPSIDWHIENFQYANLSLGRVSIRGAVDIKEKNAWRLESCTIDTPFYQVNAAGLMSGKDDHLKTEMDANMHISDLAKTLEFWKLSPVVSAKKGILNFKGDWPGAFYDFSLTKLNGQFNMQFKNGFISNLDAETEKKLGVGKLLSILSLQTLPRRLTLDFSDLSQKGYSFDLFKGEFKVDKGLMVTDHSFVNGPIAYVSMKGSLDIARHAYDMTVKITPYVAASLPLVATIAGGPVAGIATWVASKIINKGMQKVSGYTYKITGPWKQPIVQQVSIHKVL